MSEPLSPDRSAGHCESCEFLRAVESDLRKQLARFETAARDIRKMYDDRRDALIEQARKVETLTKERDGAVLESDERGRKWHAAQCEMETLRDEALGLRNLGIAQSECIVGLKAEQETLREALRKEWFDSKLADLDYETNEGWPAWQLHPWFALLGLTEDECRAALEGDKP